MRRLRLSLAALATLAVAVLAACASGGGMGQTGGDGATATVVVNNNLTVPASLTVSILPETGIRRLLGSAVPGRASTLSVAGSIAPGRHRLHARTTSGTELLSDPFTLTTGSQVTWDLQSNIVRVTDP